MRDVIRAPARRETRRPFRVGVLTAAVVVATSVACVPEESKFAPWPPTAPGEIVFVAAIDGRRLAISHGPFSFDTSAAPSEPVRELYWPGRRLTHISLSPASIRALVPEFPIERASELSIEVSDTNCVVSRLGDESIVALDALEPHVRDFDGERFVDSSAPLTGLFLRVPADTSSCFSGSAPEIHAFGESERLLAPGTILDQTPILAEDRRNYLRWAVAFGPEHVIAFAFGMLFVFERDAPWRDDPRLYWPSSRFSETAGPGAWEIAAADLDSTRSEASRARILLAMYRSEAGGLAERTALVEIEWTPSGFGEPVILFEAEGEELRSLFIQADGRFVAVGARGLFVTGTVAGEPVERRMDPGIGNRSMRAVLERPSEAEPLVVLDNSETLFFGSATNAEPFRVERPMELPKGAYNLRAVELASSEELILLDSEGPDTFLRRPDGSRGKLEYQLPNDFEGCADPPDACGFLSLTADRTAMTVMPQQSLVLAPGACSASIEVDPNTGCARTLRLDAESPAAEARGTQFSVTHRDGFLTIAGAEGRLLRAAW